MVSFFKSFDYRTNQKLVRQPFVLIFAILNLLNHKHTPPSADPHQVTLIPFLSWGNDQTWLLHLHPLFVSTLELILFYTCFRGRIATAGDYRAMLTDPMRERISNVVALDTIAFNRAKSPFAEKAMFMIQVIRPFKLITL